MKREIELIDLEESAKRTYMSVHTWRRWASTGRIPTVKLGRRRLVDVRDLERIIKANRKPARSDLAV